MLKNAYTKNEATSWAIPNYWDAVAFMLFCALLVSFVWGTRQMLAPYHVGLTIPISLDPWNLPNYALRTILRLFIALGFSLVFTFVVGLLAAKNKHAERLIIPVIDVLQSAPVISFLTITTPAFIALFHGRMLGPECAAIFSVFTAQVWNMTLSFYQSLRTIPAELEEAAAIFHLSSWQKFWRVEVPYSMPGLLWNMMMSMSGSWLFITIAEAFPIGGATFSLPGIGSYMSQAIAQADNRAIVYAIVAMLIIILIYDQLLFRPLVYWSQRFKGIEDEEAPANSLIVNLLQNTKLLRYSSALFDSIGDWFVNPAPWLRRLKKTASAATKIKAQKKAPKHHYGTIIYYGVVFCAMIAGTILLALFLFNNVGIDKLRHAMLLGVFTGLRVLSIIALASLILVPLGVWIGLRPRVAAKIQPLIQFLAAFPVNLLFPVIGFIFLKYHMNIEIWVSLLMIMGTQWYILFNVIAGASALPKDIKQAAAMLRVKGWLKWRRLLLPGIAPYFITGAITAAGGAWNVSILAEVIAWHNTKLAATGLGSYITEGFTNNDTAQVILGTIVMCIFVIVINRILWRPLYNSAVSKFSLEQ